jgi:hypothetical protein
LLAVADSRPSSRFSAAVQNRIGTMPSAPSARVNRRKSFGQVRWSNSCLACPVEALRHACAELRRSGTVLVVDERVDEVFTAPGDEVHRFFAAASAIWCVPGGRVGVEPEPVGAVIRPADMRPLAERATCLGEDIVAIEHPFWRFSPLMP